MRISSSTVALIAVVQIAIGAFAHAGESDLLRAAEDLDVKALTFLMATAKDPNERHFAKGVIAATMNDDVGAEINLEATAIAASLPQPIRCKALGLLAGVFLRQTRFADAAKRWDAAQNLGSCGAPGPEEVRSRAVALTLQGEPVMSATVPETGETPLRIDWARLMRANVLLNGSESEAVLDTGASYSTISVGKAKDLGVRLIPGVIAIGTATGNAQARLGIADQLDVAGARFNNVTFIVLDDDALSFAWGFYRIPMIVGLPVLRKLGRLEVRLEDDSVGLRYDRLPGGKAIDANLALDGLQLLATVKLNEYQARLLFDTGARSTLLNRGVAAKFPDLMSDADRTSVLTVGAGGTKRDQSALNLDAVNLDVAGRSIKLANVKVTGDAHRRRDGILGQDVLTSGRGYVLDFGNMRLELLEKQ
ncbi:MAG: retroviral-like aspartic protease family protein [Alphaproteobacteria bacterium]|nr:retroviral-like aspartic protease family protein [Alphaproteobacteria bacterium]